MIDAIAASPLVYAIGWALTQFVWQGAVVGAATAALLTMLSGRDARTRYGIACLGLLIMVVLPVVGLLEGSPAARGTSDNLRPQLNAPAPADLNSESSVAETQSPISLIENRWSQADLEGLLPGAVLIWLVGVLAVSLRMFGGWVLVRRLRNSGAPVGLERLRSVESLARRLGIVRPIRAMESALISVPAVIGWLRPVLLLPASALAGLSPEQLEAIIAHELAHVRRHDYLINMLQTAAETLLFYHPAVWWLSKRIRIEREHCCDDIAVAVCGDADTYVGALATLEEGRTHGALAMAANGGSLLARARRLLDVSPQPSWRTPAGLAVSGMIIVLLALVANVSAAKTVSEPIQPTEEQAARRSSEPGQRGRGIRSRTPSPEVVANSRGNISFEEDGLRFDASYEGTATISDDDRDVIAISEGGYLSITEIRGGIATRIELRATPAGGIERRFIVDSSEREYEPEGRRWLAERLPAFLRRTAFAANARVERILESGGVEAVLTEISRIGSDHSRRVYYMELSEQADLTSTELSRTLDQAAREIGSDYELRVFLELVGYRAVTDLATRDAYFNALSSVGSDFETRRALTAALTGGELEPEALTAAIRASSRIGSDFELATLLVRLASNERLEGEVRAAYVAVMETIGSDFERSRARRALAGN